MSSAGAKADPDPESRLPPLDEIACDGCGRSVMSTDGPALIAVIVGPCPDCGGTFRLVRVAAQPATPQTSDASPAYAYKRRE